MWAWGTNEWGDQGPVEITLSGQSVATSLGALTIQTAVQITGQEAETDLGSLTTSSTYKRSTNRITSTNRTWNF